MKLKYYLRGLGIGIIVTTVILAVSFSKKEIKMSDEEIMARAAQLGMVMQETETTEQGDTEQDPDGTDTGAKTEVVTEQTASELLEERTAAEETAQNTEAAAEDVAAEAQENSANTDEETQAQQEAAGAEDPSGVYRLVIQKGDVCRIVCEKLAENGVISDAETFRQYLSQIGYASNMRVGNYDIPYGLSNEEIAKIDEQQTTQSSGFPKTKIAFYLNHCTSGTSFTPI